MKANFEITIYVDRDSTDESISEFACAILEVTVSVHLRNDDGQ